MPQIANAHHTDSPSGWSFNITDRQLAGRLHINPNKLNYEEINRNCQYQGCVNTFRINRRSGLCSAHERHQHDLLLELVDPANNHVNIPTHVEIINQLIKWSKTRNYDLVPLFSAFSFNILGNIPDVSTLAGEVTHVGYNPPLLQILMDKAMGIVDDFFPDTNNSSYQPLETSKGNIPARILAITFAGLILCEEANRGDRWFWRQIKKDEKRTELLGGAMPIAYFAAISFPWGVEIGKAANRLTP